MTLDPLASIALILAAGLILAMWRDRKRTRRRCAKLLRGVRRRRDLFSGALRTAGDEYQELYIAHEELLREALAYRAEDARREAAGRERRQRLN